MRHIVLLLMLLTACESEQHEPKSKCNMPSVLCSNGEYYNGLECPNKLTVVKKFICDSVIYKRR